jgi:ribosomal protein S18 acetylase RimI-like enzyme
MLQTLEQLELFGDVHPRESYSVPRYRQFLNTDPPRLAEMWRGCTNCPELLQPLTAGMFESLILNKPYFERAGLIIAEDEQGIAGFAHGGFGPDEQLRKIDYDLGVTSMLLVHPRVTDPGVTHELLRLSEAYLQERGARVLYGGSIYPLNPFYLGLYGGSESPGILVSDEYLSAVYRQNNYQAIDQVQIYRRNVADFHPAIDRRWMQIRRKTQIAIVEDPPSTSWWNACTQGEFERREIQLLDQRMGNQLAGAMLRNLDPPAAGISRGLYGLTDLWVDEHQRRQGYGAYLLNETLKYLAGQNNVALEVQTMQANTAAIGLYNKLGFNQVNTGIVYRKA